MFKRIGLGAWLLLAAPALAMAQDAPQSQAKSLTPEQQQEIKRINALLESEHPQFGDVKIGPAQAALHLGDRYYMLGPDDAKRVLIEGWRNPPGSADGVLGVIFPRGKTFADSWGAVVTYDATGYVSDRDAKSADYDKFLDQSRQGEDDANKDRGKSGFPAIHLVGWAQAPAYDPASHSEIWARQINFAGQSPDTLNYDTRILGRHGVLSLNLVARMDELQEARAASTDLARTAGFDPGARYADYQEGQDKKAAFGIGGLIAAGLGVAAAQKLGLLALLVLFAKKGLVVIAAAGAWLYARFKKIAGLGRKPKGALAAEPEPQSPGPDGA